MLLNNDFLVEAPADRAWSVLTDLERVAACMPGATLDGREDDDYVGGVKVKVGPITANFHGTARFVEQDDAARTATIVASGKDPRGQASASATIKARLQPEGSSRTRVVVDTDLEITGRMAQFGRGAIADVSVRLLNQFAQNLSGQLAADGAPSPQPPSGSRSAGAAAIPAAAPSAAVPAGPDAGLDALSLVMPVLVRRGGPFVAVAAVGVAIGWGMRGRREWRRQWVYRPVDR